MLIAFKTAFYVIVNLPHHWFVCQSGCTLVLGAEFLQFEAVLTWGIYVSGGVLFQFKPWNGTLADTQLWKLILKCIICWISNWSNQIAYVLRISPTSHPMITHTINSYRIPHIKWNLHIHRHPEESRTWCAKPLSKKNSPNANFGMKKNLNMRHTRWTWLIRCVTMQWIWLVLWKIQSEHNSVYRQEEVVVDRVQ